MKLNVSISDATAYDRDGALPDRFAEADAVYGVIERTVKSYKRGTDELAKRLQVPVNSLRQKVNPNNQTHNFHPAQLMLLMREADDMAILNHMAHFLGCVVHPDRRSFEGDLQDAMAEFQVAVAELVLHAAHMNRDRVQKPSEHATANNVNRLHFHAQEVEHALMGVQRAADAMRRPAPEV